MGFEPSVVKIKLTLKLTTSKFSRHNLVRVRAVSRLCEIYPDICLTTEEKARKTSVRVAEKCQIARFNVSALPPCG